MGIPEKPDDEKEDDKENVPKDMNPQTPKKEEEDEAPQDEDKPGARHEKRVVDVELRDMGLEIITYQRTFPLGYYEGFIYDL
jgi:hypothetical protein